MTREIVDTPDEAAAQELAPLLVREPLAAFLDSCALGAGPIEAERVGEGHSNVTYLIRRGGYRSVLRRPPRPPLPPSAHDVLREARLLQALEETAARVPRVLAVCDDDAVLGVPFYVMEEVEGTVVTNALPASLSAPSECARIGADLIDALVEIHAVDWRAAGLEGFGKPTGYLERQLRRFNGLWQHNKTRELTIVAEVGDWLAAHMPESPPATIVHGDYRLGNVMLANDPPARVASVFDWELATIGDPLADVGYLTVTWVARDDPPDTMFSTLSAVTREPGFPSREELIARYEERSGRSMGALHWYQALALWKAAVFMEGNYKRFLAGASDDEFLAVFDEGVPALAEKAREIARAGS
jgi:aminoglycoside phosphotransferase (APT) family kinase protein